MLIHNPATSKAQYLHHPNRPKIDSFSRHSPSAHATMQGHHSFESSELSHAKLAQHSCQRPDSHPCESHASPTSPPHFNKLPINPIPVPPDDSDGPFPQSCRAASRLTLLQSSAMKLHGGHCKQNTQAGHMFGCSRTRKELTSRCCDNSCSTLARSESGALTPRPRSEISTWSY
jgi:hypothetical protein